LGLAGKADGMNTVALDIKISGVGIHSGAPVDIVVKPSKTPGIFFKRTDLDGSMIPAAYDNVSSAVLQNTTIGDCPDCVQTIEHLMAALFIARIDSAIVEINGPEVPIVDGSAKNFVKIFKNIKKTGSKGEIKKIIIKKEIVATRREIINKMPFFQRIVFLLNNFIKGRKSNGFVRLSPDGRGLVIDATLDYPDKIIQRQRAEFIFDGSEKAREDFIKNFAAARTFGSIREWEWLKRRGMGRGANENNVIALNKKGDGTLNRLQCPDEFVRHKIIDILGDMALSGGLIVGRLESYKGSHGLNNLALRKLFSDPDNYVIKTGNSKIKGRM
jgi:UDP-3-O-[3-hydroxymyristoyl] N-acetylglucosamine deacetylase